MEAALHQSKALCPFLRNASPAKLRALSTSARPRAVASPGGGTMSKLQLFAHRCPIMGKALTIRSAHHGRGGAGFPGASLVAGIRAMSSHSKSAKAKIHTSSVHEARPVGAIEPTLVGGRDAPGSSFPLFRFLFCSSLTNYFSSSLSVHSFGSRNLWC